jgi:hypothetical protein
LNHTAPLKQSITGVGFSLAIIITLIVAVEAFIFILSSSMLLLPKQAIYTSIPYFSFHHCQ